MNYEQSLGLSPEQLLVLMEKERDDTIKQWLGECRREEFSKYAMKYSFSSSGNMGEFRALLDAPKEWLVQKLSANDAAKTACGYSWDNVFVSHSFSASFIYNLPENSLYARVNFLTPTFDDIQLKALVDYIAEYLGL